MATKFLWLANFLNPYDIAKQGQFIKDELVYIIARKGNPGEALFIPYAYQGPDYNAFFAQVSQVFLSAGIKLADVQSGDPSKLIPAAKMIVICGGDLASLISRLNAMITGSFNPYDAVKKLVDQGIPFIGWNEGAIITSPNPFTFPGNSLTATIKASPYEMIHNYNNENNVPSNPIKQYLSSFTSIRYVFSQVNSAQKEKSSVRLEESGGGIIDTVYPGYPTVTKYYLENGQLKFS